MDLLGKQDQLNNAEIPRERNGISLDPLTKKSKRTHRKKSQVPGLIDSYEGMQRPGLLASKADKRNGKHESKKSKLSKLSETQQEALRRFLSLVHARMRLKNLFKAVDSIRWAPRVKPSEEEVQEFVKQTAGRSGTYVKDTFKVASVDKIPASSCIGSFQWTKIDTSDPAKYMVVNMNSETGKSYNTILIRFFMEHVWGIRKPDVVISVTGGAMQFDLSTDEKDKIMRGMMEGTKSLNPLFVTGGTNAGIMKYVGEARAKYNPHAPLLGIATFGSILGSEYMLGGDRDANGALKTSYEEISRKSEKERKKVSAMGVGLDVNHTHFIFADDGSFAKFGRETQLRADIESCISVNLEGCPRGFKQHYARENEMDRVIFKTLLKLRMGWEGQNISENKVKPKDNAGPIPIVSVCVQGGMGTVNTVLDAVNNGTASILVRGSGKAADLLADAVLIRFAKGHKHCIPPGKLEQNQRSFLRFLTDHFGLDEDKDLISNEDSDEYKCYNFTRIMEMMADFSNVDKSAIKDEERRKGIQRDAAALIRSYELPTENTDNVEMIRRALAAVVTNKCWVFNLHDPEPNAIDFKGSLLQCLLNGIGRGRKDNASALQAKLKYSILWQREDILQYSMKKSGLKNRDFRQFVEVLNNSYMLALARNNVRAAKMLLEHGASIDIFRIKMLGQKQMMDELKTLGQGGDSLTLSLGLHSSQMTVAAKKKKSDVHAMRRWSQLIKMSKGEQTSDHVMALSSDLKDEYINEGYNCLRAMTTFFNKMFVRQEDSLPEVGETDMVALTEPFSLKIRRKLYKELMEKERELKKLVKRQELEGQLTHKIKQVKDYKKTIILQSLYTKVLGSLFRYKLGTDGPYADLFLWNVLMNRREMSEFFWQETVNPVLYAITAAYLLRNMSEEKGVDTLNAKSMQSNADHFEELAIGVYRFALQEDLNLAIQALDSPLRMWRGMALLDLAVMSKSETFVEKCCQSSIENRFYGDMSPYDNNFWRICLGVFPCCGLLAMANFFEFKLPPTSEVLRSATQRRKAPDGFPYEPRKNDVLLAVLQRKAHGLDMKLRRLEQRVDAGDTVPEPELKELWMKTFSPFQKFVCFWAAPIVLYLANAMQSIAVTIAFTLSFMPNTLVDNSVIILYNSDKIHQIEWVLVVYFISSLFREVMQMAIAGYRDYLMDVWNIFDLGAMISFALGFALHFECISTHCNSLEFSSAMFAVPSATVHFQVAYGCCLFFMYLRLLRIFSVNRTLGVMVLITFRMLLDVLQFAYMYGVFLIAFAALMVGAGNPQGPMDRCHIDASNRNISSVFFVEGQVGDYLYSTCYKDWWLYRTLFQAWGDFYTEEMTNDFSIATLLAMYVIMNIVLLNLLIAIMAGTYDEIKQQSDRQWLIDLYQVTREFTRIAIVIPAPFNVFSIIISLATFLYHRLTYLKKYPGYNTSLLLDLHFSHSKQTSLGTKTQDKQITSQERKSLLRISAFMEHVRSMFLEEQRVNDHVGRKLDQLSKLLRFQHEEVTRHDRLIAKSMEKIESLISSNHSASSSSPPSSSFPSSSLPPPSSQPRAVDEQLARLAEMYNNRLLSADEFVAAKALVLRGS